YGRVLVTNRSCNNLIINKEELFGDESSEAIAKANESILMLCRMIESYGDTWNDELPITREAPFEYTEMGDIQRARLNAFIKNAVNYYGWEFSSSESSAVELMAYIRWRYNIDDNYTSEETRIIAGIRYEINVRYLIETSDYVFAEDVSMDLITTLLESTYTGFDVVTSYVREYNTTAAAHVLGYIGLMNDKETALYTELGYPRDAKVGKDGAEYAFEEYLHGTNGKVRKTSTASGVVTDMVYLEQPEPGNHVYLTIDIGLQEASENALTSFIVRTNEEREAKNAELDTYGGLPEDYETLITGGAVVAVDVNTGEPLAIASYPTFDLSTLMDNFSEVMEAENAPLFNRALQGTYAPGSTFKPLVGIAALHEGKIDVTTTIDCAGQYEKYDWAGYAPACWIWNQMRITHDELTLAEALTVSCNYYFYEIGDYLQITKIAKYAAMFGLGEKTGIELYEEVGVMASDEYMQATEGRDMYAGDTLAAAIGQSVSLFTPIQMAEYTAALANNGTRYSASVLKAVRSYDFSETIYEREPVVLSTVETDQSHYDIVHEGMYGVANDHLNSTTVTEAFWDAKYSVAAKTGTAQIGLNNTNAFLICYAPYENPEIAVCVALEKGASGAS
ncbi:MAG: penicillin-binding protein, partial [Oscillospiraceae bacterium]|nr:penicillin-binding protein [Oscillospiraceae bacterium]